MPEVFFLLAGGLVVIIIAVIVAVVSLLIGSCGPTKTPSSSTISSSPSQITDSSYLSNIPFMSVLAKSVSGSFTTSPVFIDLYIANVS